MLPKRKIVLNTLQKCRKLPRLMVLGLFPLFLMEFLSLPPSICAFLYLWGMFFLGMFFLEGLYLGFDVVFQLERRGKLLKVLEHIPDMELDPYEKG